jgi:hypothetical protein
MLIPVAGFCKAFPSNLIGNRVGYKDNLRLAIAKILSKIYKNKLYYRIAETAYIICQTKIFL